MRGLKTLIADNIKETRMLRETISKDGAEKIKKYDELMKNIKTLSNILSIKTVKNYDDLGNPIITVMYKSEIKPQQIYVDESGNIKVSDLFKAINALDLISYKDMEKLNEEIASAKSTVAYNK